MTLVKKLLVAMLLVSMGSSALGNGTFASFNATTTNAISTFATGSLILSNKVGGGVANSCFSNGATQGATVSTNSNANCNALFSALTANKPGDTATVALELKNEGNVTGASGIKGLGTVCTASNTPDTGGATATQYHGAGNPCSYVQIKVQETQSNYTTALRCMYDASGTNPTTCGTGNDINLFVGVTSITNMTFQTPSVAAGQSRYVVATLTFPNGAAGFENQYMGRVLSFGIQWALTQ